MTAEEYRRAVELFAQLQDMAVEERQAALDAACVGNAALRAQTLRLLEADSHASGGDFLGRPAIEEEVQSPGAGTVLGNYRLGQRIGAGGMGIVYEAQDQRLHRRVALKIMPQPFAAEGSERIKRFQQEARAASLLSHPNIVSIFDAGADQGFYYSAREPARWRQKRRT